ncbi:MAG: D-alanyl-D-alanine dipeptidase [Alphaproteobacteria bacterium]|nr:MAG: D-alanyl-D-alanine dipeptidase [Alphaproteobacteria bacterium]TAF76974.1 MAG: D-alanyl-D-alanine dipeptidase [Alphaproteobacteria bacterium]
MLAHTPLIEITPPDYDVVVDIRYATAHNFTNKAVYARPACFLHPDAATCVRRAIAYAADFGMRLKIFDAYRPPEAQWVLWNHTPDPNFLADPAKGSPHSRGVAVDLTLLDAQGHEVDMGTAFDEFSPRSHHGAEDITTDAKRNRLLLLGIMTSAGFDFYRNEWWHYQLFNSRTYDLIPDAHSGAHMMPT